MILARKHSSSFTRGKKKKKKRALTHTIVKEKDRNERKNGFVPAPSKAPYISYGKGKRKIVFCREGR